MMEIYRLCEDIIKDMEYTYLTNLELKTVQRWNNTNAEVSIGSRHFASSLTRAVVGQYA